MALKLKCIYCYSLELVVKDSTLVDCSHPFYCVVVKCRLCGKNFKIYINKLSEGSFYSKNRKDAPFLISKAL